LGIARRAHAVTDAAQDEERGLCVIVISRANCNAEISFLLAHARQNAYTHTRNGKRDSSKIVPVRTVNICLQPLQRQRCPCCARVGALHLVDLDCAERGHAGASANADVQGTPRQHATFGSRGPQG
jgi:hypothetical protein